MKRSLLEIYALAVCFVTMLAATIALGIALWDVVQIAKPDFTISNFTYENHQDNESFDSDGCAEHASGDEATSGAAAAAAAGTSTHGKCLRRYTEREITERREASWAKELRNERRQGFQSLVRCLIFILVVLAAFALHWRMARRERHSSPTSG